MMPSSLTSALMSKPGFINCSLIFLLFYYMVVPVGINWSSRYLSALFVANFIFVDSVMFHLLACK